MIVIRLKILLNYIMDLFLTVSSIIVIIAFSNSYFYFPDPQGLVVFWKQIQVLFSSFFFIGEIQVKINEFYRDPLLLAMKEPYIYSMIILSCALAVSFLLAVLGSFVYFIVPKAVQRFIKGIVFLIQSIPDVVFVFSIQLFVIWVYKKTELLVVNPIAGFENVYVLPILTVSVLPSVMLFQMLVLSFKEENEKPYSEYAKAKGLSRQSVLIRHIFRNTLVTVFSNTQYLFWFILSNLLVIEYLFNMDGFFSFLYRVRVAPEIMVIGLTFLFIPFYIIDAAGKRLVEHLTGEGEHIL